MLQKLTDEISGVTYSFGFHPWNSNFKKAMMYAFLVLFIIMAISLWFDWAVVDTDEKRALWTAVIGVIFGFFLGRNTEGEVRHRRRKRGDPEE